MHPAFLAIFGIGILTGMDVLIKTVGPHYPTFQLVFLRFVAGSVFAIPAWLIMRPGLPTPAAIRANLWRGVIVVITASTFFYALQTLPLAEAVAFSFLSPIFLAIFGALILGEGIGQKTIIGLVLGTLGVAVMASGQGFGGRALPLSGVIAAVLSAVSYAFGLVLLRQRAQVDALITIIVFQNLIPAFLLAGPAFWVWVPPRAPDLPVFLAMGAMGLAGHLLIANAFKRIQAALLAPTEYSALVFAALFGFLFFGEWPGVSTILGSILVVIGTAIAMRPGPKPQTIS